MKHVIHRLYKVLSRSCVVLEGNESSEGLRAWPTGEKEIGDVEEKKVIMSETPAESRIL